jgi:DNA-binding PadR family transcriptional regulator
MPELTDLEGAALADIARNGPTTSYAVAKSFAQSPSEFWSGSAGAVYPLIKRLQTRGLLAAKEKADGKRARTDYAVTAKGRVELKNWLLDSRRAAGIGFDPLRTRAVYLDLVSASERGAFLDAVQSHLDEAATVDVWPDSPRLQKIHATVMKTRKAWIRMLDFLR